jgi:hypothetical protein
VLNQVHKRELRPRTSSIVTVPSSFPTNSKHFDPAGVPATIRRSSLLTPCAHPRLASPPACEPPPTFAMSDFKNTVTLPPTRQITRNTTQQMSKKETGMSTMLRSGVSCGAQSHQAKGCTTSSKGEREEGTTRKLLRGVSMNRLNVSTKQIK